MFCPIRTSMHMVSKVVLLQPTQLEIIATSSINILEGLVMQDKEAHLKAQIWQFKVWNR